LAAHYGNLGEDEGSGEGTSGESPRDRLRREVTARDDGRARRYVATVRPAMAALKYVRGARAEDSEGSAIHAVATTEEGDSTVANDVAATTEEGDERASTEEVSTSEEGGSSAAAQQTEQGVGALAEMAGTEATTMTPKECGVDDGTGAGATRLNDHLMPRAIDVAQVRVARKAAQREAKARRVLQATRRAAIEVEGVESVERVVK
jgi:hypothetical protein